MATFEKGDMWQIYGKTDTFCITTNAVVKSNDRLVMGRGIALQAKEKLPGVDLLFGLTVKVCGEEYGFMPTWYPNDNCWLGMFQVKYHWRDKADLKLIEFSTIKLIEYIEYVVLPDTRIDLNFPGIGNGQLDEEEVMPIILQLPDNVHIWRFE